LLVAITKTDINTTDMIKYCTSVHTVKYQKYTLKPIPCIK